MCLNNMNFGSECVRNIYGKGRESVSQSVRGEGKTACLRSVDKETPPDWLFDEAPPPIGACIGLADQASPDADQTSATRQCHPTSGRR